MIKGLIIQGGKSDPILMVNAVLLIPNVAVRPSLDDIQEAVVSVGRLMTSVSKGVGQWTGGKGPQVSQWYF